MEERHDDELQDDEARHAAAVADWEADAGWRAREEPGQGDHEEPGTDEQIQHALVDLLMLMRPDWGPAESCAARVTFAQQRLNLPLPRVCADAVRLAAQPDSPPDAFITLDARVPSASRPADADRVAELLRQTRRHLAGRRLASRNSSPDRLTPGPDPVTTNQDGSISTKATDGDQHPATPLSQI